MSSYKNAVQNGNAVREKEFDKIRTSLATVDIRAYMLLTFGAVSATFVADPKLTARVIRVSDSRYAFEFGVEFWSKLNRHEKVFLILHECYHALLYHFKRFPTADKYTNTATDLANNAYLLRAFTFKVSDLPFLRKFGVWTDTLFKRPLPPNLSAEEYWAILKHDDSKKQAAAGQGTDNPSVQNGAGSESGGFDSHENQGAAEGLMDKLADALKNPDLVIAQLADQGIKPARAKAAINQILEDRKSQVSKSDTASMTRDVVAAATNVTKASWSRFARRLRATMNVDLEETWMPHRRFAAFEADGDLMFPREQERDDREKPQAVIYIDTSGSTDYLRPSFKACLEALRPYFETYEFCFDDTCYKYDGTFGMGGTQFDTAVRSMNQFPPDVYRLVFTDCDFDREDTFGDMKFPQRTFFIMRKRDEVHRRCFPHLMKAHALYLEDFTQGALK